jgi:hypothetical protein
MNSSISTKLPMLTFVEWEDAYRTQESYDHVMRMNQFYRMQENQMEVNLQYINPELLLQVQEATKSERL